MKQPLPSTPQALVSPSVRPWWKQRRVHLSSMLMAGMLFLGNQAQAAVIITVGNGPTANYRTITQALDALPAALTQAYELHLLNNSYSEDVLLNKTGTAANTLTIRPAAGVTTAINGTLTFGAGSAYAIVSGNNGLSSRKLTLNQSSQTAAAVVFSGDASHNTVTEAKVTGSNSLFTSGIIVIGEGTAAGNDYNALTQSQVGNASPSQLPANLVYAANAGAGTNDGFTLTNNELFNFTRSGVVVGAGNGDQWNISNNSFYYNANSVPTTAQTGIDFAPGSGANDATVAGNYIGGQAANAAGGVWTNAGSQSFRGIVMNCGTSSTLTNEVTGNTVSNVSLTGVGSSAALTAFGVDAGRSELSTNTVSGVSNTGTSGVNSLVSRATTVLGTFSVSSGQLMVVESGLTVVLGDLTNRGILNHTGGDILINGNFTNSGTFAQTLGDIEIKGNMINSGQFTCSTGKVKLTGNGAQTVSGGFYFNLEVNGAGTKTLTGNATVYNGVQMLNGVLSTARYTLTLDRLANLTETDASYVLGRVDVDRTPTAGATEDFGGVGLEMLPASNSNLPGSVSITRITGTAPVGVSGNQGIKRYFDIDADVTTGLDLTMTMRYLDHELNGIAPANLHFYKSNNAGVTWQDKGVSSSGANFATLNSVDGFSRWTLGNLIAPLPVSLTAFQAERQGRNAVLTWATATEQDNRGFGIEVSLDGKNFREIGFVAAEGANSVSARNYRFVDAAEGKTGTRYYRLRQQDNSGKAQYYGPRQLTFDATPTTFAAYPTQFASDLTVELGSPAATATLRLFDGMGREVWRQEVTPGAAPQHVQPAVAAGAYVLTATVAGQVLRQRVVKN